MERHRKTFRRGKRKRRLMVVSPETQRRLKYHAKWLSEKLGVRVYPMQVAAAIVEGALK